MEEWADNPEEYSYEEAGDAWMFSLRPCTERLYVELIKQYVWKCHNLLAVIDAPLRKMDLVR